MSIFTRWFGGGRKAPRVTLAELRVEEKRLEIRENQALARLEKIDREREEIFHQGAKTKSPARRRIYARRFTALSQRAQMLEREVLRIGKELITIGRLRAVLERERKGGKPLLERLKDEDIGRIMTLLEDDRISEEVYLQKIDSVLGIVTDKAYETEEIGEEGMEVLKAWERMDEGELDFDAGLREAAGRKERETGEQEPAADEREGDPA